MIDIGQLDGGADDDFAAVRLFNAGDHLEQCRFAGAVGPDDADDGAGRNLEAEVVHQQTVAEALGHAVEFDDLVAQTLADRDEDFLGFVALLVFDRVEFLEAVETRLGLGLARFRVLPHPFQFLFHGLDAAGFLFGFGFQAGFLLFQPTGVVAFPRDAVAAVEFQNPLGGVVEEVAVVSDGDDGAGETHQELFQPFHRFGVEVVGGFVQQQHVRLFQQQFAQRDAALLAAGQFADHRVPCRQAQRVGGDFHLLLGVGSGGGNDRFQPVLFLGQLVEIGVRLGVGGIHLLQLLPGLHDFAQAGLDFLAHGLVRMQLRFLRQIADADIRLVLYLAVIFLVGIGHDAQHRRLAGAIQAEQADLGAGEEGQRDVLDDLAFRGNDFAHSEHRHYVLGHGVLRYSDGKRVEQSNTATFEIAAVTGNQSEAVNQRRGGDQHVGLRARAALRGQTATQVSGAPGYFRRHRQDGVALEECRYPGLDAGVRSPSQAAGDFFQADR